jgi:hypothetical protein
LGISVKTIERLRRQFCGEGMMMFGPQLRKIRCDKKIDARVEAPLMALTCQSLPVGKPKWELKMLADRSVELKVLEHISTTMVGRLLKNELRPFPKKQWVIPAEKSTSLVCQMDHVLDL